jgi:hypothetical protein
VNRDGFLGRADVLAWLAEMTRARPTPPRPIDQSALRRRILLSRDSLIIWVLGLIFIGLGVLALLRGHLPPKTFTDVLILGGIIVALGTGGIMLVIPLVAVHRVKRALGQGVLAHAQVISVEFGRRTLASPEEAIGERLVDHPRGAFRTSFGISAPWRREIHEGSVMDVLVHPQKRKILFDLGFSEDSPKSRESPVGITHSLK